MSETTDNTPATLIDTFHLYDRFPSAGDDIFYTPSEMLIREGRAGDNVIVSPFGESLLQGDTALLHLLGNPQIPTITEHTFTTPTKKVKAAVKRVHVATSEIAGDPSGIELFGAIRDLEAEGIVCAAPIAATSTVYINEWIRGSTVSTDDAEYRKFMLRLMDIRDKLVANGTWRPTWIIDVISGNVRQKASSSNEAVYVVIDPIAQFPNIPYAAFVAEFNRNTMKQG